MINKEKMSKIPGTADWIKKYKDKILKKASENNDFDFDKTGKILAIENAFSNPLQKKVAYMIATSHEYKKPNVKAAIIFAKNYKWEVSNANVIDLQGINKPIIKDKVNAMAQSMKGKKIKPLICVNQFHGIRPQTKGKKILVDGHHRIEACKILEIKEVPIYKGTYTGGAEKSMKELREKTAMYKNNIIKTAKEKDPYSATKTVAVASAIGIPADMLFDLTNDSYYTYKTNKGRYGSGLNKIKNFLKSPELKDTVRTFAKKQKSFALPASAAIATIPVLFAARRDYKNKYAEYKQEIIEKTAAMSQNTKDALTIVLPALGLGGLGGLVGYKTSDKAYRKLTKKQKEKITPKQYKIKRTLGLGLSSAFLGAEIGGIKVGLDTEKRKWKESQRAREESHRAWKARSEESQRAWKARSEESQRAWEESQKAWEESQKAWEESFKQRQRQWKQYSDYKQQYSNYNQYNKSKGTYVSDILKKTFNISETDVKTKSEMNKIYKKLVAKFHPDVNKASDATKRTQEINDVMDKIRKSDWYQKLAKMHFEGIEKTAKIKSQFQKLKENKVSLTPEEKSICMKEKAVWHFNGGSPSPAVWKSVDENGKVTYITNTHRAYNTAPTLKGAIGRFHKFIKSTA